MFRTPAIRLAIAIIGLLAFVSRLDIAFAQNTRFDVQKQVFSDTIGISKSFQKYQLKSNAFYDTILKSKSGFVRWIGHLLIGARSSADDATPIPELQISQDYFDRFSGKIITGIFISGNNIFGQSKNDDLSWSERTLNKLHRQTREWVIRKNLLFHVGDTISPYEMAINEQLLRNKGYLATAFFIITNDPANPNGVQISIFTRDNWTISAGGSWGSAPYLDVFDRNFIGSGNMLLLRYYGQRENQRRGVEANYVIDNIWGTFARANLKAGVGSTNNALALIVNRDFIMPSDHLWGLRAGYTTENKGMQSIDTMITVNTEDWGAYYGYAWNINSKKGTTIYSILSANLYQFHNVPKPTATSHPFYSDRFNAMLNIGISRQNFYQGNMIYGYGRVEDIPYGFKFELLGGWEDNHVIGKRGYIGTNMAWGKLTNIGYLNLGLKAGAYIQAHKPLQQGAINASLRYFSPLYSLGSTYVRQFLNMSYTYGINRLDGERERIGLGWADVRGMRVPFESLGTNRFVINAEAVFFTPIFLYHFRFAFFTWADFGWLGMKSNVFKNPFTSAIGLGVRIKNERLIFNNIQLRIGFSLSKLPESSFNWFQISNEQVLHTEMFKPQPATPFIFE